MRVRPSTSLVRRVPAFLTLLLVVVVGTAVSVGYFELRRLLVDLNEERLTSSATVFAGLLSSQLRASAAERQASAVRVARAFVGDGGPLPAEGAAARLDAAQFPATLVAVALTGEDGACIGFTREAGAWMPGPACLIAQEAEAATTDTSDVSDVGPLIDRNGAPHTTITTEVSLDAWRGRVVQVITVTLSPDGDFFGSLIAPDARLLLGNADGSVWTDFNRIVPGPPVEATGSRITFGLAEGVREGVAVAMGGLSWVALAHRDQEIVVAPAAAFLRWSLASGLLLIVLGSVGGWLVTRRVTDALRTLTEGAEGVARGEDGLRVDVDRTDELGRLATAFNEMAERVDNRRHSLEAQVAERTETLEQALVRLGEAQDQLLRQERLATLGQLAGSVGHELRNPLGVMTNALYYLDAVQADAPPKVREYMQILRDQVGVSERIVSDLLDFGRVSTPDRTWVDVGGLVRDALASEDMPPDVDVVVEVVEDTPRVFVDAQHMTQVLANLVSNAVQAMNGQGTLTLRARTDGDMVALDVSDTGPGIPEDQLERIFEPLVTTKARGIGLGLALCRMLSAVNHASLSVSSRLGVGSTFTVSLPRSGEGAHHEG